MAPVLFMLALNGAAAAQAPAGSQVLTTAMVLAADGNPWALPETRAVPAFPNYFDSADSPSAGADTGAPSGSAAVSPQAATPQSPYLPTPGSGVSAGSTGGKRKFLYQLQPRFVTPEVLDQIRQQQMQTQQALPAWPAQGGFYSRPFYRSPATGTRLSPGAEQYGSDARSHGNGSSAVPTSPWDDPASGLPVAPRTLLEESMLYKGEPLPLVPDPALGGIAPLDVIEPLPPVLSTDGISHYQHYSPYLFGPFGDVLP